ncbi:MAG: hypothetical protein FWF33_06135 [Clostridiales bacterium]|nr:hypothetical protein [Clostridiales bacterium]
MINYPRKALVQTIIIYATVITTILVFSACAKPQDISGINVDVTGNEVSKIAWTNISPDLMAEKVSHISIPLEARQPRKEQICQQITDEMLKNYG